MATSALDPTINFSVRATTRTNISMGPDVAFALPSSTPLLEVAQLLKDTKGIPLSRMAFTAGAGAGKLIPRDKWDKSLRQNAIYDKSVLRLSPTTDGVWMWEPLSFYQDVLLHDIKSKVDPEQGTRLVDLAAGVTVPLPLRGVTVRDFVRKYPDVFSCEVDTKASGDERVVKLNARKNDLPTWT